MKTSIYLAGLMLAASTAIAQGPPDPAEFEAERSAAFAQADADGSGGLSLEEFKSFEAIMRERMAARHFERMDSDSDGAVTLAELEAGGPGPHGPHGRHGGPPPF